MRAARETGRVHATSFVFTRPDQKGGTFLLTEDVDAANLLLHLLRVDLAHVAPAVRLLHLSNLELPDPGAKAGGRAAGLEVES